MEENKDVAVVSGKQKLQTSIKKYSDNLVNSLPGFLQGGIEENKKIASRLVSLIISDTNKNPMLAQCDVITLIGAYKTACELGLVFLPNSFYVIPYRNNKKGYHEAQFQLGYLGAKELFFRHGSSKSVEVRAVYENDEFSYGYGLDPFLNHKPTDKEPGKAIYYYAVLKIKDDKVFEVMSREAVETHMKKYSKGWDRNTSSWKLDFNAMAKKTVLLKALKLAPCSTDEYSALMHDNATRNAESDTLKYAEPAQEKEFDYSSSEKIKELEDNTEPKDNVKDAEVVDPDVQNEINNTFNQ